MIAREITAEDWGKLSNDDQALYNLEGESYKFIGVNPSKLLTAKKHESDRYKKIKEDYNNLQKEIDSMKGQVKEDTAKSAMDSLQSQNEAMKKAVAKMKLDHAKALAARDDQLKQIELQRVIAEGSVAFENPHLGALILEKRLDVDFQDGQPTVRYKNRDGDYDETLDLDGLIKDVASDDRFRGLGVQVSPASGAAGAAGAAPQRMPMPEGNTLQRPRNLNELIGDRNLQELSSEEIDYAVQQFGGQQQ